MNNTEMLSLDSLLQSLQPNTGIEKVAETVQVEKTEEVKLDTDLMDLLTKQASEYEGAAQKGRDIARDIMTKLANEIVAQNAENVANAATELPTVEDPSQTIEDVMTTLVERGVDTGGKPDDQVPQILDSKIDGEQMRKEAQEAGALLAQEILTKLAGENVGQLPGDGAGAGTNQIIAKPAIEQAEHAAIVSETPGGEINEIFQAIVAKAQAAGAVNPDATLQPTAVRGSEGVMPAGPSDEVEKVAAVNELVAGGVSFDDAVALVKAAAEEIEAEEAEQVKVAAVNELMSQGYGIEDAVALVKQAETYDGVAERVFEVGKAKGKVGQFLSKNKKALAIGAGVAGAAGLGAMIAREKKAALDQLMAEGVDFDNAVALVQETSQELYGC